MRRDTLGPLLVGVSKGVALGSSEPLVTVRKFMRHPLGTSGGHFKGGSWASFTASVCSVGHGKDGGRVARKNQCSGSQVEVVVHESEVRENDNWKGSRTKIQALAPAYNTSPHL